MNQQFDDAKIVLESIDRANRDMEYYLLVSQVTLALQQYDFAIEALQIARGYAPNDLNIMLQLARTHLNLAVENSMGDLMVDSFIQLGSLHDKNGNIDESVRNYSIAHSLAPTRIEIDFYIASAYDRTGSHRTQARDHFRKYLNSEVQRDQIMENYARSRISRLNEEIHFRGQ